MSLAGVARVIGERSLPRRSDYAGFPRTLRHDLVAGITVGVVALPLALAFGVSSGVGAEAGLVTAIVAGIVAAVFGGSNLQVSGPTGAMTVVLIPIVARYGATAVIPVAIMAGGMVLLMGLLGLGRAISYIPWPVVEGFTIGIAIIIFLQQVPLALGVEAPESGSTALRAIQAMRTADWQTAIWPVLVVVIVVLVMIVLGRIARAIPASIIAIVIATLIVVLVDWPMATIGVLPSSLPAPSWPVLDTQTTSAIFSAALAVAALAAIESLLSARVADGMSDASRLDPDRELFGQGLANIASGIFGGMPATGAIARTAVNVRAGARTRVSAIVHSLLLLLIVLFAGALVAAIPIAALAGVLMVTSVRMVDRHSVRAVLRSTRADALVLVATAIATVVLDLIVAVEIGIAVAAVLALRSMAKSSSVDREVIPSELVTDDEEAELLHDHIAIYRIDGALFFGAAQRFLDELVSIADVRVVILRLGGVRMLDASGAHALVEIVEDLSSRQIDVVLQGVVPDHLGTLRAVGAIEREGSATLIPGSLADAVAWARSRINHGQSEDR